MKKTLIGILIGLVVGGLLIYQLAGPGFWHKAPAGERNSFYPVTGKLDAGGPFYLYASTESVIRAVGEFSAKIRAFIPANPETTQAVEIFDFIAGLIKKSGLAEISGVGISSIPIDAELRRMRLVIHHYRDQGKGILWQVMGEKPHGLEELKLLPADTVLASFSDFDIHALWQWFKSETEASKLAGLKKTIFSAESMLQKLGIPFEKVLQSLSGGMGALVTLDAKKNMVIPIGGTTLTFPEPGLALLFAVKDDTLFNLIAQKIPFGQKTEEKGVKKLLIPLPPLPFPLKPAIVQRDGWLIVAAHEKLIEAMFAAREKKNGLLASSEFQKLAAGIPTKGNGFRFLSPRFSRTLANIQKVGLARIPGQPEQAAKVRELFSTFQKEWQMYGVLQNTAEGVVFTLNHNMKVENVIMLPAGAVAGVIAAIAVPNMLTAAQKAKQKATMADMKLIATAIALYTAEKGKPPPGNSINEIAKLLEPAYLKQFPRKDRWGHDFIYSRKPGKKSIYFLASAGKEGLFKGFDQKGFYPVTGMSDFDNDIILANGEFVFGPKLK